MNKFKYLLTAIAALTFISCGDGVKPDPAPEKPVVKPDAASGITFSPEAPDADQPCTIYFNPTRESAISSALFNCTTDIYAHIGIFHDEEWNSFRLLGRRILTSAVWRSWETIPTNSSWDRLSGNSSVQERLRSRWLHW